MATNSEIPAAAPTTSQALENNTLTLKSYDGEEFAISQSAAVQSATIKYMVEDGCAGDVIPLPNVHSKTLSKIVIYLEKHANDSISRSDLKIFDDEFYAGESLDDLFAGVMAANYLSIKDLIEIVARKIADSIQFKSVEEVQQLFNINDFLDKEEEDKIKADHSWAFQNITRP